MSFFRFLHVLKLNGSSDSVNGDLQFLCE